MFKTSPVNYNEIVKTAPQKVLDNPQCAYLLDADVDTTDLLQKAFGIICSVVSFPLPCPSVSRRRVGCRSWGRSCLATAP